MAYVCKYDLLFSKFQKSNDQQTSVASMVLTSDTSHVIIRYTPEREVVARLMEGDKFISLKGVSLFQ